MLTVPTPREAYRRTHFRARVESGTPDDLVIICLDEFLAQLATIDVMEQRGNKAGRSLAISRAVTALITLELGVDHSSPLAPALLEFYRAAKSWLLGSLHSLDREILARCRADFEQVRESLKKTTQMRIISS